MSTPLERGHFYEFGPFCLDPAERRLLRENQTVSLPPKSFDLLVLLVENHDRLVTKNQILDSVWAGSFVEESNLTVSVSAIRRALGERGDSLPYIETVPKAGYRFIAPVRIVGAPPTSTVGVISSPSPGQDSSGEERIVSTSNVLPFPVLDEIDEGPRPAETDGSMSSALPLSVAPTPVGSENAVNRRSGSCRDCPCSTGVSSWPSDPGKECRSAGTTNSRDPSISQSQG